MKKFKKLSALLLAAIMVLTMAVPVMAEEKVGTVGAVPSAADKGMLTVTGVEEGAAVKAYRIVNPVYNSSGLEKWEEWKDGTKTFHSELGLYNPVIIDGNGKFMDDEGNYYLTEDKINAIWAGIKNGTITGITPETLAYNAGNYEKEVGAGMYIVVVTPAADKTDTIYNPAIASIYYSTTDEISTNYEVDNENGTLYKFVNTEAATDVVYAATNPDTTKYAQEGTDKYKEVNTTETINILAMQEIPSFQDEWKINPSNVKVKHSTITLTKEITGDSKDDNPDGDPRDSGNHGDDHGKDDEVYFKATTKIPMWDDVYFEQTKNNDYVAPIYKIIDTMTDGLKLITDKALFSGSDGSGAIKVTIGTGENAHVVYIPVDATNGAEIVHLSGVAGHATHMTTVNKIGSDPSTYNGFELQMNYSALFDHRGENVTIEYGAYVDIDKFDGGFLAEENDVKVEFSNDPTDLSKVGRLEDKTFHYTFNIDGDISGEETTGKRKGHEIIKTEGDENFDWLTWEGMRATDKNKVIEYASGKFARLDTDNYFYEAATTAPHDFTEPKTKAVIWEETTYTTSGINGLNDAEFTLTMIKNADGVALTNPIEIGTVATHDGGYMNFNGLDAGTYTLKETKAPAGYSTNTTEYYIVISAEYNDTETTATKYLYNSVEHDTKDAAEAKAKLDITGTGPYTFGGESFAELTLAEAAAVAAVQEVTVVTKEVGRLVSYSIARYVGDPKNGGVPAGTTTYTYSKEGKVVEEFADTVGATFIKNTKNAELPSTGGMGTYLFTIAGVAILGVAAFLLIVKRRRA